MKILNMLWKLLYKVVNSNAFFLLCITLAVIFFFNWLIQPVVEHRWY
jgi:hypothetical protein